MRSRKVKFDFPLDDDRFWSVKAHVTRGYPGQGPLAYDGPTPPEPLECEILEVQREDGSEVDLNTLGEEVATRLADKAFEAAEDDASDDAYERQQENLRMGAS